MKLAYALRDRAQLDPAAASDVGELVVARDLSQRCPRDVRGGFEAVSPQLRRLRLSILMDR